MKQHGKRKLIAAMVIFGTIGPLRRLIPYSSGLVAFARALIGVLFLLLLRLLQKQTFPALERKKDLLLLALSGVLLGFNWMLLFEAYRYTTVSVATVSYYMAPVFMLLASVLFLHAKLTRHQAVCALVAVVGMVLVSEVGKTGIQGLKGVFFGLGAAALYASVVILNKKITGIPANDRTLFQLGFAALALLPYVLLTEDVANLTVTPRSLFLLAVAGIVHTGLAYALYFDSLRQVSAQTVAIFSYIDPAVAVLLSACVLREPLSLSAALGVLLVIGAAIISELPAIRNKDESE